MRIWMTGGTGFVGSNLVAQAVEGGHEVLTTVRSYQPEGNEAYQLDRIDMCDPEAVRHSVSDFDPDLIIHCAIMNDLAGLYRHREAAWQAYVEATRITARAASAAGAGYILVSTDWVFDGTQVGADETTPPNPVNLYGVLKLASEMVALEMDGAVARVSGVNGVHRARSSAPRAQDPGYGYFVASIVDALAQDRPFTVWESADINMVATPSLASESADLILDIGTRRLAGVFHCCGAEGIGRMDLARLTCEVFDLDEGLLRSGPPDSSLFEGIHIPFDTTITRPSTSELLEHSPTPIRTLLERFRAEYALL